MKLVSLSFMTAASLLLTACAGNRVCNADAAYRRAAAIPPIQPAEGLQLPQSPSALKVPEITATAKAAAIEQPMPKRGKGTACLDYPPDIAPLEAASEPVKG